MLVPNFKNKKVLVMGLGLLGGGIATTKWLVRHGAKVTVTDLRTRKELAPSIKALGPAAKKARFVLGKHNKNDFKNNEIVVVNPAVRRESEYLKIAKKAGARLENEATLFFKFCRNPIIAVTGTRGKTTTVNWIYRFLKTKFPKAVLTGNSSETPMLGVLDKLDGKNPVVVELSSWHLEILPEAKKAPPIVVITNLYQDHLNRYRSMTDYARAKANIFKDQTEKDILILNRKNPWTRFFLKRSASWRTKSKIVYFPAALPINKKKFEAEYGSHNLDNFAAAFLAAKLQGVPLARLRTAARNIPTIPYREEIIVKKKDVMIVNDTTATSPDGTIAALNRFGRQGRIILIAGGTDKNLEYGGWARTVKKFVKPENLYLLNGSATKKMIRDLKRVGYFAPEAHQPRAGKKIKPQIFEDLKEMLLNMKRRFALFKKDSHYSRLLILFSPASASFEKFKNEFDRGEKFSRLAKKFF